MKKKIFSTLLLVAFAWATTSMFVSCKDYDDDINANKDRISKLETTVKDLQASINTLNDCCTKVQGEIDALKSGKADKADLEELSKKYGELSANLVKLEERVQALEDAKKVLEDAIAGKASQADLDALRTELAGIDQKIADALEGYATINYVDAAKANLQAQIDVFEKYRQALLQYLGLTDDDAAIAKVKEMVENLKTAISKIGSFPADDLTQDEITKIRQLLQNEDGEVNKFLTEANVLQFLLTKQLTGLVAYDMSMIGGVEHIEVPAMYYQPVLELVAKDQYVLNASGKKTIPLEEFHYINPGTNEVFESDKFGADASGKPLSAYLFDAGEMAPKASLGGVHSWKDFATKYGEGDKDQSVLSFYKTLVSEFTRLKTAQLISHGTFKALTNPSSVDLSNTKFNFFTDTRIWGEEVESREGKDGFAVPMSETVNGKEIGTRYKDGVVEVDFTIPAWEAYVHQIARTADGNYVKNPFAPKDDKNAAEFASLHDSLNWVSLQAQVGEVDGKVSTVSSDFVVVTPALLHVQALADNEPEAKILDCHNFGGWTGKNGLGGHLWKQARTAIAHAPTHSVAWNRTLDILPFIETHFTNLGFFMTWMTYDKKMEADMFKQLGLKYRFAMVDWWDDTYETSQSVHMSVDPVYDSNCDFGLKSVILTPHNVNDKGEQISGQAATARGCVGRKPLLRVELVDQKDQILEVGYILLEITENYEPQFVEIPIRDHYYMNCNDANAVTWAQVEALILDKIGTEGISKEDFEKEYELETYPKPGANVAGNPAIQYTFDPTAETKSYTRIADADTIGVVRYTTNDKLANQTNVLEWAFTEKYNEVAKIITGKDNVEDARAALLANKGAGYPEFKLVTTVRFVKKGADAKIQERTAIYVDLIVAGDQVHFAYADSDKKETHHWKKLNSLVDANQLEAIEVHLGVPSEEGQLNATGNRRWKDGTQATAKSRLDENEFWRNIFECYQTNPKYQHAKWYFNGIDHAKPHVFTVMNADKFDKFAEADGFYKHTPSFKFVLPQNGKNAANVTVVDGTWQVYGYSHRHDASKGVYTLSISADGKKILDQHGCIIASIYRNNDSGYEIVELGYNPDEYKKCPNVDCAECREKCKCAEDILNYAGMHGESGEFLLESMFDEGKTFTAYAEIVGDDIDCYPILIDHRYINFRFQRPISVWPVYKLFKDGINVETKVNEVFSYELVSIADWRNYSVQNITDAQRTTGNLTYSYNEYNGLTDYDKAQDVKKDWPYQFVGKTPYYRLGVEEIYINPDEILTDGNADPDDIDANHALIFGNSDGNGFVKVNGKDVYNQEALRGWIANKQLKYMSVKEAPGAAAAFDMNLVKNRQVSNQILCNKLGYIYNEGNTRLFHYFVPVYVRYAYGETNYGEWTWTFNKGVSTDDFVKPATFKVWVVVTCMNTISH